MDPLSDILTLLKPRSYTYGGFDVGGDWSIGFPAHEGIKCYAVVSGQCWLSVDGVPDAVRLETGDCFLLPLGRFPNCKRSHADTNRLQINHCRAPSGWDLYLQWRRRLLWRWRAIRTQRRPCRHAAEHPSADRAYPERIGPGRSALVARADDARVAGAEAGRLSRCATPCLNDVNSGPAAAPGGGSARWCWVVIRPCRQEDEHGDRSDAPRSGAPLDITGTWAMRRHVAVKLRFEIQGHGWDVTHGIPDPMADAVGRRQADQFGRPDLRHCYSARVRIRERLQRRIQANYELFATAI